ncbi:hypothetical protein KO516_01490 [Citreicella sp. C3M06]|uniref:hypothetical protein n=1 Tax=Citreicella sp. C3M06 TaxID=2841564 RepID=UPI001C085BBA|nr:hypothetical protein [Citreicella sp. C3M06]MBU2959515.1 hypothetical protein [Citreicella sp. C3M06]
MFHIQGLSPQIQILSFNNNNLDFCLFFNLVNEAAWNQGKLCAPGDLPTELSTETVDVNALDLGLWQLQQTGENRAPKRDDTESG